jgi:amino acid permease
MASSAYVAHYNAPKIWNELKSPSKDRYNTIVSSSFTIAGVLYTLLMAFGFLTFGGHSNGMILNNYASSDQLAVLARFATGVGVLCGYPLSFFALRDTLMHLLEVKDQKVRDRMHTPMTIVVLALITAASLWLRDVGIVVSLSGALVGTLLIFILPALMNLANGRRGYDWDVVVGRDTEAADAVIRLEANAAKYLASWRLVDVAMLTTGAGIAIIGLYNSIKKMTG